MCVVEGMLLENCLCGVHFFLCEWVLQDVSFAVIFV